MLINKIGNHFYAKPLLIVKFRNWLFTGFCYNRKEYENHRLCTHCVWLGWF